MMECDGFSSNQVELVSRYLQHVLCFDPTAKLDESLKEKKVEYTRNRRNQLKDQGISTYISSGRKQSYMNKKLVN